MATSSKAGGFSKVFEARNKALAGTWKYAGGTTPFYSAANGAEGIKGFKAKQDSLTGPTGEIQVNAVGPYRSGDFMYAPLDPGEGGRYYAVNTKDQSFGTERTKADIYDASGKYLGSDYVDTKKSAVGKFIDSAIKIGAASFIGGGILGAFGVGPFAGPPAATTTAGVGAGAGAGASAGAGGLASSGTGLTVGGGGLGLTAGTGSGLTLAAPAVGSAGGGLGLIAPAGALGSVGAAGLAAGSGSLLSPSVLEGGGAAAAGGGGGAGAGAGGVITGSKLGDQLIRTAAGQVIGSLAGGSSEPPPPPPVVPKTTATAPTKTKAVSGMPDPQAQQRARKRSLVSQLGRRGRAASVMTTSGGRLGG